MIHKIQPKQERTTEVGLSEKDEERLTTGLSGGLTGEAHLSVLGTETVY